MTYVFWGGGIFFDDTLWESSVGLGTKAYARLPVFAQHAAVSAYGAYWKWLRFGSGFEDFLRGYQERERYSFDDWSMWQKEQLRDLLASAYATVPYYKANWTAAEVAAAKEGELSALPLLEKDPIRSNPRSFLRTDLGSRPIFTFHTSGTSGTPIASMWTRSEIRDSLAVREARSARWAGVSFSLPRATFSGRLVEPNPISKGPYHRYNIVERQAYLSAFHLKPETAHLYVEALRKHNVQWITGYAVSSYLLAKFILEKRLSVSSIKAVITTSEKVTPGMRAVMEKAYGCKVFEEYSTVENALFASECEKGSLHVSPDVGVVEILRPDGSPCKPGEVGEVVATCLMRHAQPFIRYRLGDLAAWDANACPCGRSMPIIKEVTGRIEDVIVGPDGRQMVRFHGIFVDQPHVREGQVIQETRDSIRVSVVVTEGFNNKDEEDIRYRIQQRLTSAANVVVEVVPEIPRTPSGKFKAVISLIKRDQNVSAL